MRSLRRGLLVVIAGVCLIPAGVLAADPPNLEKLSTRPSLWPKQVALKEALTFKDASGKSAQLPVGTVGEVVSIQPQGVGVDFKGTILLVPAPKTDLAERLPEQASAAVEEAKKREAIRAAQPKATPPVQGANSSTKFLDSFAKKLVAQNEGQIAAYPPQALSKAKYLLFYYAAGNSPESSKFAPGLVDFYNKVHRDMPKFEIVLVSRDASSDEMNAHMAATRMPWPAIAFQALGTVGPIVSLGTEEMPCLVLTDREGKVLSRQSGDKAKQLALGFGNLLLQEAEREQKKE